MLVYNQKQYFVFGLIPNPKMAAGILSGIYRNYSRVKNKFRAVTKKRSYFYDDIGKKYTNNRTDA